MRILSIKLTYRAVTGPKIAMPKKYGSKKKRALGAGLYQNRGYMSYAWKTLEFKVALEHYVQEVLEALQTAQGEDTVCTASLRLSILEHICSCWGDNENAVSIHESLIELHQGSRHDLCETCS